METIATLPVTTFERLQINGMEVLFAPRPGSGLVAAAAVVLRGAADEHAGEHGLASFTTQMLMRGTRARSSEQLAFDLESIGAMVDADAGRDTSSLSLRAAAPQAEEGLRIMFEVLREPAFEAAEHEIHRAETLA